VLELIKSMKRQRKDDNFRVVVWLNDYVALLLDLWIRRSCARAPDVSTHDLHKGLALLTFDSQTFHDTVTTAIEAQDAFNQWFTM
jgi:hypothetical protein